MFFKKYPNWSFLLTFSNVEERTETRWIGCSMVPIVRTSFWNSFSLWLKLSNFFTATTLESSNVPLKTEPNPPPPISQRNFLLHLANLCTHMPPTNPPQPFLIPTLFSLTKEWSREPQCQQSLPHQ